MSIGIGLCNTLRGVSLAVQGDNGSLGIWKVDEQRVHCYPTPLIGDWVKSEDEMSFFYKVAHLGITTHASSYRVCALTLLQAGRHQSRKMILH